MGTPPFVRVPPESDLRQEFFLHRMEVQKDFLAKCPSRSWIPLTVTLVAFIAKLPTVCDTMNMMVMFLIAANSFIITTMTVAIQAAL